MRDANGIARLTLCAILAAFLLGACKQQATDGAGDDDPQWISRDAAHPNEVAVVFVHGILGSTKGTWRNANGATFFDLLRNNPKLEGKVDTFAFGFASNKISDGSLDIREATNKMDEYLISEGVWKYKTIVFVGHSMGGLVAMHELERHPDRLGQVPLIVLFATPQEGADITRIAKYVLRNPAIEQMYAKSASEFLKDLWDRWPNIPASRRPTVACAYEKNPTYGVVVVDQSSATRFCDGDSVGIENADHLSIVKPDRFTHPSVVMLVNRINTYVFEPSTTGMELPDFAQENGKLVYNLRDLEDASARVVNHSPRTLRITLSQPIPKKLLVTPETPKDIYPEATERLSFNLLLIGELVPEYTFTLTTPATPSREVIVRLSDVARAQAQQAQKIDSLREGATAFVSGPGVREMSGEEVRLGVVKSIRQSVNRANAASTPDDVQWVLTADALAALGWSDLAKTALVEANRASPTITKNPSVIALAQTVDRQLSGLALPANGKQQPAGVVIATPSQLAQWEVLSDRMQKIDALSQNGKQLEGDLLMRRGQPDAARFAYEEAYEKNPNAMLGSKIAMANTQEQSERYRAEQLPVEPAEPRRVEEAAAAAPPRRAAGPHSLEAISTPAPRYPEEAMRRRQSGEVTVLITVGIDGLVTSATIVDAKPPGIFDHEVLEAVRRWQFQPSGARVKMLRTFSFSPDD